MLLAASDAFWKSNEMSWPCAAVLIGIAFACAFAFNAFMKNLPK